MKIAVISAGGIGGYLVAQVLRGSEGRTFIARTGRPTWRVTNSLQASTSR